MCETEIVARRDGKETQRQRTRGIGTLAERVGREEHRANITRVLQRNRAVLVEAVCKHGCVGEEQDRGDTEAGSVNVPAAETLDHEADDKEPVDPDEAIGVRSNPANMEFL